MRCQRFLASGMSVNVNPSVCGSEDLVLGYEPIISVGHILQFKAPGVIGLRGGDELVVRFREHSHAHIRNRHALDIPGGSG
jgi:hypothetical protein